MAYKSRVLYWNNDRDSAQKTEKSLSNQGIGLEVLAHADRASDLVSTSNSSALVMDFSVDQSISEAEFGALHRAAEDQNMRVIYLTPNRDALPGFIQLDEARDQIVSGPALDQQLQARLRLLARIQTMEEEITRRSKTSQAFGIEAPFSKDFQTDTVPRVLLVGHPSTDFQLIEQALASAGMILVGAYTHQMAQEYLQTGDFDLVLYNADSAPGQTMDFANIMRLDARYHNTPLLVLGDEDALKDPLDIFLAGANDIIYKPVDEETFLFQAEAHIREYRYHKHLTSIYESASQESVLDQKTGLYSYGFLMDHLTSLVENVEVSDLALTIAFFNTRNLKTINRTHGYAAGDALIRQIGCMIAGFFRGEDLCARYGGGEFVAILPRTRPFEGSKAARRLVAGVNCTQFQLKPGLARDNYHLTFGEAEYELGDTAETLIARARGLAHRR